MREATVQELVRAFEGTLVEVSPTDCYGISFELSKARVDYEEESDELSFTVGNYNNDGIGTVSIKVEDSVESIECDETTGDFVIVFASNIPDVTVSKFRTLEELENEHEQKQAKM